MNAYTTISTLIKSSSLAKALQLLSIFYCVFALSTYMAFAQTTLSGSEYTLQGGITVLNTQADGAEYTISNSGDPISGNGQGTIYSIFPTPFSPTVSSGVVSANQQAGTPVPQVGFTLLPQSGIGEGIVVSIPDPKDQVPSSPIHNVILVPDQSLTTGTSWSDTGQGVFIPGDSQDTQIKLDDAQIKDQSEVQQNMRIIFILIVIVGMSIRIVKHAQDKYFISRIPCAILIDWIIALHKNMSTDTIPYGSTIISEHAGRTGVLFGSIFVPVILIYMTISCFEVWPILSLVFSLILVFRIAILFKMKL